MHPSQFHHFLEQLTRILRSFSSDKLRDLLELAYPLSHYEASVIRDNLLDARRTNPEIWCHLNEINDCCDNNFPNRDILYPCLPDKEGLKNSNYDLLDYVFK